MKNIIRLFFFTILIFGDDDKPFTIEIRPRAIDNAKILVNVEVTNHVGRPVEYLEGFLAEFSSNKEFKGEHRLVLVYSCEPALQTGFSATKTMKFKLEGSKPSSFQFTISKIKFALEKIVFLVASQIRFYSD